MITEKNQNAIIGEVVWKPSEERQQNSQLTAFYNYIRHQSIVELHDFPKTQNWDAFHAWSIQNSEEFWFLLCHFCKLPFNGLVSFNKIEVLKQKSPFYLSRWFDSVEFNFAEAVLGVGLQRRLLSDADLGNTALISISEDGNRRILSWDDLSHQAYCLATWLSDKGVLPGDRVAAVLPNQQEAVIVMLATALVGGVFSSCSPDFGLNALVDRFAQTEPKVLITCDAYFYKGKKISVLEKVAALSRELNSVVCQLIVPLEQSNKNRKNTQQSNATDKIFWWNEVTWDELERFQALSMPFSSPLYLLYSSGTTGVPKAIVHSAGGTLLQHLKELVLHTDVKPGDHLFYYSTCGWMMWNWLVSGLAAGATLVLYDGNPMYPTPGRLLQLVADESIDVFGSSARYYASLKQFDVDGSDFDLSTLKTCLSTGSPLAPELYDYMYDFIKADMSLASISGGTDIISCFALGCPWLPVRRGELQSLGLGMAVEIYDESGKMTDEKGELVCEKPFPSMPVFFWNDSEYKKYEGSYFERFPGIWAHGDFAKKTKNGGLVILGRSDSVLNPSGVRIGTAEIYRQVERLPIVVESLAIGKKVENDEEVWLFVILQDDVKLTAEIETLIKKTIRENATPRHVPSRIFQVADLPRTRSGKISEAAVKKIIHGGEVKNKSSLANPESLHYFQSLIF